MEKRKLNKVLIVLVLIIWVGVIYKYWQPNSRTENTMEIVTFLEQEESGLKRSREFKLYLTSRDPFLATTIKKRKPLTVPSKKRKEKSNIKRVRKVLVWPQIKYLGFLKKENTKKKVLLLINGQFTTVEENGWLTDEIKIEEVFKDSIIVSGKDKTKTLKKDK